jgi:hypothetical protein
MAAANFASIAEKFKKQGSTTAAPTYLSYHKDICLSTKNIARNLLSLFCSNQAAEVYGVSQIDFLHKSCYPIGTKAKAFVFILSKLLK